MFIFGMYEELTNRIRYSGALLYSLPYRKGLRNNISMLFPSLPVVGAQSVALSEFKNTFLVS